MLIPLGTIIHEKLATSYVLVEALVADLCEGGFSGVVEVVLRELDGFIVIANGSVAAVVEKRTEDDKSTACCSSSVSQLAERAHVERGQVAIRSYSTETAEAVAGRMNAQSLYARLSIEFTDLETMLKKLAREADRDWYIEINTDEDITALIRIRDRSFHVIASRQGREIEWDALESDDDLARKDLFSECKSAAGTFDVYFKDPLGTSTVPTQAEAPAAESHIITATSLIEPITQSHAESPSDALADSAAPAPAKEVVSELSLVGEEFPLANNDDAMTELKRLMGEIAGTIEGSAQAVDRRDGFAMCLRASQLKIAERYPFLDPFASEFEYLAGEIVFVGRATAEQFVAGLTEALALAVESLAQSNAYGERFRAYVREDLGKLLARSRAELEGHGLDRVIHEIASL